MTRLTTTPPDQLTAEQREQYDRIARTRPPREDGSIGGPFDPWIRSPELARRAVGLGDFIWERTTVGRRLVELAVIVTARFWESNVEWWAHSRMAREHGVAQETIDAVFARRRPEAAPEDELLAYDVCVALHETHRLPAELYARAVERFGEQGVVEIVGTIGFYTMVAMTLSAFDVGVPPGATAAFPD
ncbi:MAG TPA: carboxymuconolactone decarboxylase family protein [Candidatus Dormibacteraeota bacterium]|jgi:4-carboxymuconolactone decarboxylase